MRNGKLLRGSKGSKYQFTFEHPVPVNLIADEIIGCRFDREGVCQILAETDLVTVMTYAENNMLRASGLTHRMPGNSLLERDMFARYKASGIEIPTKKIRVHEAIAR